MKDKLQKSRKRSGPTSQSFNSTKKKCLRQPTDVTGSIRTTAVTSSTSATAVVDLTSAATVPRPSQACGSHVKPPPDVEWKRRAIATIQKYTTIPVIDKTSTPDVINYQACPEIHPHLRDKVTGDGHCGFRALSKSITGTESNHAAFRAAVVAFMRSSCAGRRRPWLVNAQSIDDYITQTRMGTTGWMTDVELHFVASLLQITINVFATLNGRAPQRRWISYRPAFKMQESMSPTRDYHLHLHHNQARDHFDRVVYKE